MSKLAIVVAMLSFASSVRAQTPAQQQAEQQRAQEQAQLPLRLSLEPTRVVTVGMWPGKDVPCKLPKRDRPYVCHRLLAGPAVILSQIYGELIVARGDAALARGERMWWSHSPPLPLALGAGDVLYVVGDLYVTDDDHVMTVYR